MGMTIDDNVDFLNEAKKLFEDIANNPSINETVKTYFIIESLESAIEVMRKYQKFQDQSLSLYMERLKADMVAMLTELQLEIEELKSYESADGQDLVMLADIGILFQQKINTLKGEEE